MIVDDGGSSDLVSFELVDLGTFSAAIGEAVALLCSDPIAEGKEDVRSSIVDVFVGSSWLLLEVVARHGLEFEREVRRLRRKLEADSSGCVVQLRLCIHHLETKLLDKDTMFENATNMVALAREAEGVRMSAAKKIDE